MSKYVYNYSLHRITVNIKVHYVCEGHRVPHHWTANVTTADRSGRETIRHESTKFPEAQLALEDLERRVQRIYGPMRRRW